VYVSAEPIADDVRRIGDEITIEAVVNPQALSTDELRVEVVYTAEADALNNDLYTVPMEPAEDAAEGAIRYRATFHPEITGRLAYGVRVYPVHELLPSPFDAHAIRWA
jgi:hypothetical protein